MAAEYTNSWWLTQAPLISYLGMVHGSFPGKEEEEEGRARGKVAVAPPNQHTPRVRGLAVAYHLHFVTQSGMIRSRTSGDSFGGPRMCGSL
jgi:hypothetical protein